MAKKTQKVKNQHQTKNDLTQKKFWQQTQQQKQTTLQHTHNPQHTKTLISRISATTQAVCMEDWTDSQHFQ